MVTMVLLRWLGWIGVEDRGEADDARSLGTKARVVAPLAEGRGGLDDALGDLLGLLGGDPDGGLVEESELAPSKVVLREVLTDVVGEAGPDVSQGRPDEL